MTQKYGNNEEENEIYNNKVEDITKNKQIIIGNVNSLSSVQQSKPQITKKNYYNS